MILRVILYHYLEMYAIMKRLMFACLVFGCVAVNGMEYDRIVDRESRVNEKCVRFVGIEKPIKICIDQKKLENEDLDKETVNENKRLGIASFKLNNSSDAQAKLIRAFFGNTYLEKNYYNLQSIDVSDNDVFWFYNNTYVGDKTVITYLVRLLPTSVFWKKMEKLIYIPRGHY